MKFKNGKLHSDLGEAVKYEIGAVKYIKKKEAERHFFEGDSFIAWYMKAISVSVLLGSVYRALEAPSAVEGLAFFLGTTGLIAVPLFVASLFVENKVRYNNYRKDFLALYQKRNSVE